MEDPSVGRLGDRLQHSPEIRMNRKGTAPAGLGRTYFGTGPRAAMALVHNLNYLEVVADIVPTQSSQLGNPYTRRSQAGYDIAEPDREFGERHAVGRGDDFLYLLFARFDRHVAKGKLGLLSDCRQHSEELVIPTACTSLAYRVSCDCNHFSSFPAQGTARVRGGPVMKEQDRHGTAPGR